MECSICLEKFSAAERRPKNLPCGHSFCLPCVGRLPNKECPKDKKRFRVLPDNLPDNFLYLEMLEEQPGRTPPPMAPAQAPALRLWCRDCNAEASEQCADEHLASLCSLKKARADRVAPRLAGLRSDEAALRGLRAELDAADDGQDAELAASRGRLVDALEALERARAQLEAAVEADEALEDGRLQCELGVRSVQLPGVLVALSGADRPLPAGPAHGPAQALARDAARLLPALGDAASSCSVSLRGPAGAWTASVVPGERASARLLLCQLACAGELRREGQDQDDDRRPDADAPPKDEPRWQEKSDAVELDNKTMARNMKVGRRVVRGADWPEGCAADGEPPGPGTVVATNGGMVSVEWDAGGKGSYRMGVARTGGGKVHELKLLPRIGPYSRIAYVARDSPAFLNICAVSSSRDVSKKADLLEKQQLDAVEVLVDLRCDVWPAWSKAVLRKVAPRLKAVRLLAPDVEHLRIVEAMPNLTHLFMSPVDTATMQLALSMPRLTCIEAHCPFEAPLGTLRLPNRAHLTFLCIGVYPLSATLAVLRAHADTLLWLELFVSSDEPHGCPDLAAELQRCGLKKLKSVMLFRESDIQFCRHDSVSCKEQKLKLFSAFLETGLTVKVVCRKCG